MTFNNEIIFAISKNHSCKILSWHDNIHPNAEEEFWEIESELIWNDSVVAGVYKGTLEYSNPLQYHPDGDDGGQWDISEKMILLYKVEV